MLHIMGEVTPLLIIILLIIIGQFSLSYSDLHLFSRSVDSVLEDLIGNPSYETHDPPTLVLLI